jgi:hypothetical protein
MTTKNESAFDYRPKQSYSAIIVIGAIACFMVIATIGGADFGGSGGSKSPYASDGPAVPNAITRAKAEEAAKDVAASFAATLINYDTFCDSSMSSSKAYKTAVAKYTLVVDKDNPSAAIEQGAIKRKMILIATENNLETAQGKKEWCSLIGPKLPTLIDVGF